MLVKSVENYYWLLHIFQNYKEALLLLEKKSPENKLAYQKSYFYSLELYLDRDYAGAAKMFKSSIAGQIDPEFTARATFGKEKLYFSWLQCSSS
jgi:hypothetical protein